MASTSQSLTDDHESLADPREIARASKQSRRLHKLVESNGRNFYVQPKKSQNLDTLQVPNIHIRSPFRLKKLFYIGLARGNVTRRSLYTLYSIIILYHLAPRVSCVFGP